MPDFLCFNMDRRDHAGLYGVAFYDLNRSDRYDRIAAGLRPEDECLVATPTRDGQKIEFRWFSFLHHKVMPDPDRPGTKVRVLFGKPKEPETLSRADAIATKPYSRFFDRNGRFKEGFAVIRG